MRIKRVVILGAGSAGLLAAVTFARRTPLEIEIIRSPGIGIIGVGEGTTHTFPGYLLNELRFDPRKLFSEAQPTWKLGLRFLWGPRKEFFYTFTQQFAARARGLTRNHGYYCDDSIHDLDIMSAMMQRGRAFLPRADGGPDFSTHGSTAFHIENERLVAYLESLARGLKVSIRDGTVAGVKRAPDGRVESLQLEDGASVSGDFFIDASGFRSELLGGALGEPFVDFSNALFCDRAIIGGWDRREEPILPYTTCETMDAGWCWQIEHERFINRGYVYSSAFIDDEAARAELLQKNPRIPPERTRVVRFRSGRYRRGWVENVIAIGNSAGFVEPLEATALAAIINQARAAAQMLSDSDYAPPPGYRDLYNRNHAFVWDEIRDFIALHYRVNSRLDTAFWQHCRATTPLGIAQELFDFYREHGPTSIHSHVLLPHTSTFGFEGYLAMLVGNRVPHATPHTADAAELAALASHRAANAARAEKALTVAQTLAAIRSPAWRW